MRIGLVTSPNAIALKGTTAELEELSKLAQRAAAEGFDSNWLLNLPFSFDALTALAVAGGQLEANRPSFEMATGVIGVFGRHPTIMAQQALTAQMSLKGRFTLGIGLSHKSVNEAFYGESNRSVAYMREYLSVLLPLLNSKSTDFQGEHLSSQAFLAFPETPAPPVLIAALGPRMLQLAGEMTDGTVLWMTGPKTIREHTVPTITAAAEEAQRPAPRVVALTPVRVTDDVDKARSSLKASLAVYGQLPSYQAMLAHEGLSGPEDIAIIGDEASVLDEISAYLDAGVTDFVATIDETALDGRVDEESERTRALLKTLLPKVSVA